jgi:hypothetical protein
MGECERQEITTASWLASKASMSIKDLCCAMFVENIIKLYLNVSHIYAARAHSAVWVARVGSSTFGSYNNVSNCGWIGA